MNLSDIFLKYLNPNESEIRSYNGMSAEGLH